MKIDIDQSFVFFYRGGDVLIARAGDSIVGCVALVPSGAGVFELSKMSVTSEARGHRDKFINILFLTNGYDSLSFNDRKFLPFRKMIINSK